VGDLNVDGKILKWTLKVSALWCPFDSCIPRQGPVTGPREKSK